MFNGLIKGMQNKKVSLKQLKNHKIFNLNYFSPLIYGKPFSLDILLYLWHFTDYLDF